MPDFLKKIISSFNKYSEITVAFAIVAIIGIIMIPMNSGVLDFLLVINITLGITPLSIYILPLFFSSIS